jgi:two-component system invasion response regulator UvrY
MHQNHKIQIAFADDHAMLRKGLIRILTMLGNYETVFEVESGIQVQDAMKSRKIPDVLILDVNMAGKDGYDTAQWVSRHYPQVKILALSMFSDEATILKMIQSGAHGYITKNCEPEKLKEAIDTVYEKGAYIPEHLSVKLMNGIRSDFTSSLDAAVVLTEREKIFLSLLCQEFTYIEIAERMFISPRTVDDYRKNLSRKLHVKGKSGLIIYAMNHGLNTPQP